MQTVANLCRNLRSAARGPPLRGPHPLSPSPRCGEGERRTTLSSPLSAYAERGTGGEDRRESVTGGEAPREGAGGEAAPPRYPLAPRMPCDRGMHGTLRYVALALAGAACGGPVTGPTPVAARLANPETTFNQLQAISAVTSTPLFESFTVLAPRFTPASATGSVALALALDFAARYSPWRRGVPFPLSTSWRGGQGVRPSLLTTRSSPPIPFSATWAYATTPGPALGTTFVWDPDTCGYIASADSGAPANGERFVLYAISQRSGLPSVPVSP